MQYRGAHESPLWPGDDVGNPVPPAFLRHIHGGPLDMELTINLLEAYGIPHVKQYPNDGLFGKLILGYPPGGIDLYVPETLLEDAMNILAADINSDNPDEDGIGDDDMEAGD